MTIERKRTDWIARTIDEAARTITLQPMHQDADADKPTAVGDPIVFHADLASDECRAYAVLHGFTQRLGDAMAQSAGTTIAEKLDAARDLVTHYESGAKEWNLKATRTKADPDKMLADLLANDPEKLAAIIAAAQAKLDNAKG